MDEIENEWQQFCDDEYDELIHFNSNNKSKKTTNKLTIKT